VIFVSISYLLKYANSSVSAAVRPTVLTFCRSTIRNSPSRSTNYYEGLQLTVRHYGATRLDSIADTSVVHLAILHRASSRRPKARHVTKQK